MAPSFEKLREANLDEEDFNDEEVDISDLREKYEVQLEQGFDCFVVIDGLPEVTEEQKPKLLKFLMKKLNQVGKTREDQVHMPIGEDGKSLRFAFVEYSSAAEAAAAIRQLDEVPLDKKHTLRVNKLTDIERFGREGRVDENYTAPHIDEFSPREHLRWFLKDPSGRGRDQFAMYRGESVSILWNNSRDQPETIVERQNWTETFLEWSPLGTYLTSVHQQGVQLWGGPSWTRFCRFPHPFVNLLQFSPGEKYLVTWSNRPISIPDEGHPALSMDDDGKNYVIWDVETGRPLRSFQNLDTAPTDDPKRAKFAWPAFKWSADDKYVARMTPGQSISVYELPGMLLLNKTSIKIEGVQEFDWAPATASREGVKTYEQLLCYWTPDSGSNPAKFCLMSLPSKEIVRMQTIFNVTDAKLHWQSDASYLCIKVDRHNRNKKFLETSLQVFRIKEKGVPLEVVASVKDTVINFAWEPKGDRFVLITTAEPPGPTAVAPKTSVSFYCPEKAKGSAVGNFRHLRTLDKKNNNAIYWSPRGRFVVVGTISNQQNSDLDFYDVDFEGEKPEAEKDLTANLQLMATADHYGVTDLQWDPSGRYVATWASSWKHAMENGYHLYDFRGEQLREEHIEKFKQWVWRPRPATLLTKDEQKQIRKNLRQYSVQFEQEDADLASSADQAVVSERRRMLEEWFIWRQEIEQDVYEEREDMGLPQDPVAALLEAKMAQLSTTDETVIEEMVEEVIEETEEIIG
jgi:translation initiation factor 3 subunit B